MFRPMLSDELRMRFANRRVCDSTVYVGHDRRGMRPGSSLESIKAAYFSSHFRSSRMPDISLQRVSQPAGVPPLNVIFVHGLGGDPVTTWCHRGEDRYFWPRGIAKEIEGAAVYTLGNPADKAAWNTGWPIAIAARHPALGPIRRA